MIYPRISTQTPTDAPPAGDAPLDGGRPPFLDTEKARRQAEREFASVGDELARRGAALPAPPPGATPDVAVEVRRTPERCVVQAGAFAVSLSRLRAQSPAGASLLVIEWEGTVRCGGPTRQGDLLARATPVGEEVFRPEADDSETWQWRAGDGSPAYTLRGLAARCVDRLRGRLDPPPAALVAAGPVPHP